MEWETQVAAYVAALERCHEHQRLDSDCRAWNIFVWRGLHLMLVSPLLGLDTVPDHIRLKRPLGEAWEFLLQQFAIILGCWNLTHRSQYMCNALGCSMHVFIRPRYKAGVLIKLGCPEIQRSLQAARKRLKGDQSRNVSDSEYGSVGIRRHSQGAVGIGTPPC